MFCIKCGKRAIAENFCQKCFLENRHLFNIDSFETEFCKQCGKFHKGPIENQIRNNIKTEYKITNCDIKTKLVGNRIIATIKCSGYIKPLKGIVKEERKSFVIIRNRKCENCVKLSGGYYEAVLQIRGSNIERIMKKVKFLIPKESIVSVNKLKEGYDIKIMNKNIAEKIASRLVEFFDIKKSYKLVGEKKGKKLYRNYYAVR